MAVYARGYRFLAYVGDALVYHTDSRKGMRDQCVRLLEHKYKDDSIRVLDTETQTIVRNVNSVTVWEWKV